MKKTCGLGLLAFFCCLNFFFFCNIAFSGMVFSTFEESLERLWLFPMPWCLGKNTKAVLHPFKCLDSHLTSMNDRNQNPEARQWRHLPRQNVNSVSSCM